MSAESSYERDKWISKLREASRVYEFSLCCISILQLNFALKYAKNHNNLLTLCRTWKNAQFGDVMIQQLESQGLKMAAEKQDYMGKHFIVYLCNIL